MSFTFTLKLSKGDEFHTSIGRLFNLIDLFHKNGPLNTIDFLKRFILSLGYIHYRNTKITMRSIIIINDIKIFS